jgi:hypothetical protein
MRQLGRRDFPGEIDEVLTATLNPLNESFLGIANLDRCLREVVNDAFPPGPLLGRLGSLLDLLLHHFVGGRWVVEASITTVWVFELFG